MDPIILFSYNKAYAFVKPVPQTCTIEKWKKYIHTNVFNHT
jgi:hypothetical protein